MLMIYQSQYDDWPTIETPMVVNKLLEKYQPQDGIIHQNAMRTGTTKDETK